MFCYKCKKEIKGTIFVLGTLDKKNFCETCFQDLTECKCDKVESEELPGGSL